MDKEIMKNKEYLAIIKVVKDANRLADKHCIMPKLIDRVLRE